jgi:polar amino acid transport system permease protein
MTLLTPIVSRVALKEFRINLRQHDGHNPEASLAVTDRTERFRTLSVPRDAIPLAITALVVSALVTILGWTVLTQIRDLLVKEKVHQGWMDALLVLVAAIPVLLFIPATRGLQRAVAAKRSLFRKDLIQARVQTADANASSWYAIGYAVFALIVTVGAWFVITNDVAVGKTFFNPPVIADSFGLVARAFLTNILIFTVAEVLILVWALLVAVARMIPGRAGQPIRLLATIYTDAFRGLPSIITIYLIGFGLPLTGLTEGFETWLRNSFGIQDVTPLWAIIALTLTYGAYVAEVYRAGIESIHPSQTMAARSLGLSFAQTMRFVIIPQAVRRIIPPLLNDFIGLQKDTALVNVIGAIDAFNQSKILASNRFNLSTVTSTAILFILITIPQARFVDRLLERDAAKTRGAK